MKEKSMGQKEHEKGVYIIGGTTMDTDETTTSEDTRYSRRAFLKIVGTGVMAASLSGLAGRLSRAEASEAGAPVYGGILKAGMTADVVGLDPHLSTAMASHMVLHHVCDSLLAIDATVQPKANLAESWDVLDGGMRYRFYLKKGVTFHNGNKMTAKDVKYSLERAANPDIAPVPASHLKDMDTVKILNDYSVEVKMKQVFAPFLSVLANELMGAYIIPE